MKKISFFRRSSHLWKDWWNIRKERFFILIYKKYQSIREFAADLPATHSVFDLVTVKNRTYGMKVISTVKKTRLSDVYKRQIYLLRYSMFTETVKSSHFRLIVTAFICICGFRLYLTLLLQSFFHSLM